MIVTINHIRAYGYCAKGARNFFKSYQLDWQDFLKSGIESDRLLSTHNALATSLVQYAQGDKNHGNE